MAYYQSQIEEIAQSIKDHVKQRAEEELPISLARFCVDNDVPRTTIYSWRGVHTCIDEALEYLKEYQRTDLFEGGLTNRYNARVTTLALNSNHGFTERNTLQGDSEHPLGINYKHDPAKAADEIIAAHGNDNGE